KRKPADDYVKPKQAARHPAKETAALDRHDEADLLRPRPAAATAAVGRATVDPALLDIDEIDRIARRMPEGAFTQRRTHIPQTYRFIHVHAPYHPASTK